MTNHERKLFWNTLCALKTKNESDYEKLAAKIEYPKTLCRYRSINKDTLNALENNELFFSSAAYFDDPLDTYFHYDGVDFDEYLEQCSTEGKNRTEFLTNLKILLKSMVHAICFSARWDNKNAWIKYASNHQGFVLEYPSDNITIANEELRSGRLKNGFKTFLYPIYYTDEAYNASAFVKHFIRKRFGLNEKVPDTTWEQEKIALVKDKCHEHDEEWRLLLKGTYNEEIEDMLTDIFYALQMMHHPEYFNNSNKELLQKKFLDIMAILTNRNFHALEHAQRAFEQRWAFCMNRKDKNVRDFNCLTIELEPSSLTLGLKMSEKDKEAVMACVKKAKIQKIYQARIDEHNKFIREQIYPE